jgi:hypothetical protein
MRPLCCNPCFFGCVILSEDAEKSRIRIEEPALSEVEGICGLPCLSLRSVIIRSEGFLFLLTSGSWHNEHVL